jgi:transposase-like protein
MADMPVAGHMRAEGTGPSFHPGDPAMAYPYRIVLTDEQRAALRSLIGTGVASARTLTRARILLKADHSDAGPGWSDAAIAGALDVNPSTVLRVRRQFIEQGLTATLARKRPDRVYNRRLDGEAEAHLMALTCSTPPDGHARWSLRMLADELVRLEVVETISHQTVHQALKKTS